jgi:hypothetical protein
MSSRSATLPVSLFVALAMAQTGCAGGWLRADGGGAYSIAKGPVRGGAAVSAEGAFQPKGKWIDGGPIPLAVHTSLTGISTEGRKSLGWGTGLTYFRPPRPVSGYAAVGSNAHIDTFDGNVSAGNFSPYGEVGVRASVPARYEDGSGAFVNLGFAALSSVNYLRLADQPVDGFLLLKLGIGWEHAPSKP